jgi:protein phosphatase
MTASASIIGTRETQQDAMYVCAPVTFMDGQDAMAFGVLCDGMGGMEKGELASAYAVEAFKSAYMEALHSKQAGDVHSRGRQHALGQTQWEQSGRPQEPAIGEMWHTGESGAGHGTRMESAKGKARYAQSAWGGQRAKAARAEREGRAAPEGQGSQADRARARFADRALLAGDERANPSASDPQATRLLYAADLKIEDIPAFMEEAANRMNQAVCELSDGTGVAGAAGTTMTAVVIDGRRLYWASVGDSRIYIYREGKIAQVTRDHNYMLTLREMAARGEISEREALTHSSREALISYIGMGELELVDVNANPFSLMHGDIVLLCSDGLTKSLSDGEITSVISGNYGDLEETARLLPRMAFSASPRSQDNTSVVLLQYYD